MFSFWTDSGLISSCMLSKQSIWGLNSSRHASCVGGFGLSPLLILGLGVAMTAVLSPLLIMGGAWKVKSGSGKLTIAALTHVMSFASFPCPFCVFLFCHCRCRVASDTGEASCIIVHLVDANISIVSFLIYLISHPIMVVSSVLMES